MKKKQIIIELVAVLLGAVAIGVGVYLNPDSPQQKEKTKSTGKLDPDTYNSFVLTNKKTVDLCIEKENCDRLNPIFSSIIYQNKNSEINKVIAEINETTEKYYQQMKTSTLEAESCVTARTKYNYSLLPSTYYNLYENNQYISIAIAREVMNLCTRELGLIPTISYFYDKSTKKFLTEEQRKQQLNISDQKVEEAIIKHYNDREKIEGVKKGIEELRENGTIKYSLYYSTDGDLLAAFLDQDELGTRNVEVVVK